MLGISRGSRVSGFGGNGYYENREMENVVWMFDVWNDGMFDSSLFIVLKVCFFLESNLRGKTEARIISIGVIGQI